jgi:trans-2,3-dihydro-3-hydroxyanthranilate isomerase
MSDGLRERLAAYDPFPPDRPAALRYLLLDVFAEAPLEGNPLAVFLDGTGLQTRFMQALALELNLSETVFLQAPVDGGDARARIFTPRAELPFAGHPVLGCAVVLARALGKQSVTLETGMGTVAVRLQADDRAGSSAAIGRIEQPLPSWDAYAPEVELLRALGVERSTLPVEVYVNGPRHVYVALGSERELAELAPDMAALTRLGAVCANCFCGAGHAWRTRMFAPALGVAEDPATGSAAGPLAVHLARHGLIAFGEEIEIRQGQQIGRPSLLRARADGAAERLERVEVAGRVVVVAAGAFAVNK